MAHYTNYAIEIQDNADAAPLLVGSIGQANANIETNVDFSQTAGTFYSEQVSVTKQQAKFSFNSFNLPQIFGGFGLLGRSVTGGVSKVGVALYQALYNDSVISAGATHRRLRWHKSYTMMRRMSVSHQQDASIDMEGYALYDGLNNPVIPDTNVALPALPASAGRWTLGKIVVGDAVNSVEINCKTQLDMDFGVGAQSFGCDSEPWDSRMSLNSIQPRVSITGYDVDLFQEAVNKIGLLGLNADHANTSIYLRKRNTGQSGFVADNVAEHILITMDGLVLINNAHSGQGNANATASLEIYGKFDGTNAPIIFTPNSQIV